MPIKTLFLIYKFKSSTITFKKASKSNKLFTFSVLKVTLSQILLKLLLKNFKN